MNTEDLARARVCSHHQHQGRELELWANDRNTDGTNSWLVRIAMYHLEKKTIQGQVTGFLTKPGMQVPD